MDFDNMTLDEIEKERYRLYNIAGKDKQLWISCAACFLYLIEKTADEILKAL